MTETFDVAVSDIADTYLIMSHGLYVLQGVASVFAYWEQSKTDGLLQDMDLFQVPNSRE